MKDSKTELLVMQGLVAGLYAALTWALPALAFGPIQFRLAEVMTLLAFYNKKFIPGLTIGCAIANILSPFGIYDILFGTLASLLALILMSRTRNLFLASLMPALMSPIIGLVILLTSTEPVAFFLITGQIMISEILVVTVLGIPFFKILLQNHKINHYVAK